MVDGYFCAVLYDSKRKRIVIISDRYGLKPLFIMNRNGLFAWSSELKGLFPLHGFDKIISGDSIRCFLDVGHFIGNLTWFEGVSMMPPSTMLVYDIEAATEELGARGYQTLVANRTEPWGQIVTRLLSPEGLLIGLTVTPWMRESRAESESAH